MKRAGAGVREPGAGKDQISDKPRILIADDEQSMREWMRLLFQRDGFEVLTAEDGIAARDLIAREYVDVVLTDIRMPRLDGVSLLKDENALDRLPFEENLGLKNLGGGRIVQGDDFEAESERNIEPCSMERGAEPRLGAARIEFPP